MCFQLIGGPLLVFSGSYSSLGSVELKKRRLWLNATKPVKLVKESVPKILFDVARYGAQKGERVFYKYDLFFAKLGKKILVIKVYFKTN